MTEMEKSFGHDEHVRQAARFAVQRDDMKALRDIFTMKGKDLDAMLDDLIEEALWGMSNFEHSVRAARLGQTRRILRAVRLGRDAALMAIGAAACWFLLVVITA